MGYIYVHSLPYAIVNIFNTNKHPRKKKKKKKTLKEAHNSTLFFE